MFLLYCIVSGLHNNSDNNQRSLYCFLDFVEKEGLYDIFSPSASNMKGDGGFKINSNDSRLIPEVRKYLYKCTRTFVSTVDNKSVRLRFLAKEDLDVERFEQLSEKVAESLSLSTLNKWVKSWLVKKRKCYSVLNVLLREMVGDAVSLRTCLQDGCPQKSKVFGTVKLYRKHEKYILS